MDQSTVGKKVTLEVGIQREDMPGVVFCHHMSPLVFRNSLFEEIRLPFQGDVLHEIKRVCGFEHLNRNEDRKSTDDVKATQTIPRSYIKL